MTDLPLKPAMRLAETIAGMYAGRPWEACSLTATEYFTGLGITPGNMPADARRHVLTAVYATDPAADVHVVMAMAAVSRATCQRFKRDAGILSPARSTAQRTAKAMKRDAA